MWSGLGTAISGLGQQTYGQVGNDVRLARPGKACWALICKGGPERASRSAKPGVDDGLRVGRWRR